MDKYFVIMKKLFSVFLCLILILSIAFQCSIESYAAFGVDDVLLIGTVVCDLASMGITIYSVSEFCKSDAFYDFCNSIGNNLQNGMRVVKRNGKLFFATSYLALRSIADWAKSKFAGLFGRVDYKFMTTANPENITLSDGSVVPYGEFMQYQFLVYRSSSTGTLHAYCCTGTDVGAMFGPASIQFYCIGQGKVQHWYCRAGESWVYENQFNMVYGTTYKGTTGSYYSLNFGSGSHMDNMSLYLYRTIPAIIDRNGTLAENVPPVNNSPDDEHEATVPLQIDSTFIPGSVSSPVTELKDDEWYLIKVPELMVEGAGTSNPSISTDETNVTSAIETVTPETVEPYVLTPPLSYDIPDVQVDPNYVEAVEEIIVDTDEPVIENDISNPQNDIEIANKFRLPRSFLEGFPFSIPYSVYAGIQSFVSTPVPPLFTIPIVIPRLGISENISIDLTNFNSVAILCRSFLSVVWVVGLAMACGKFLRR